MDKLWLKVWLVEAPVPRSMVVHQVHTMSRRLQFLLGYGPFSGFLHRTSAVHFYYGLCGKVGSVQRTKWT